jgi:hypothetical protein
MNKPAGFLDQGQERAGGSGIIKNRKLPKVVFSLNWLTLLALFIHQIWLPSKGKLHSFLS